MLVFVAFARRAADDFSTQLFEVPGEDTHAISKADGGLYLIAGAVDSYALAGEVSVLDLGKEFVPSRRQLAVEVGRRTEDKSCVLLDVSQMRRVDVYIFDPFPPGCSDTLSQLRRCRLGALAVVQFL